MPLAQSKGCNSIDGAIWFWSVCYRHVGRSMHFISQLNPNWVVKSIRSIHGDVDRLTVIHDELVCFGLNRFRNQWNANWHAAHLSQEIWPHFMIVCCSIQIQQQNCSFDRQKGQPILNSSKSQSKMAKWQSDRMTDWRSAPSQFQSKWSILLEPLGHIWVVSFIANILC